MYMVEELGLGFPRNRRALERVTQIGVPLAGASGVIQRGAGIHREQGQGSRLNQRSIPGRGYTGINKV